MNPKVPVFLAHVNLTGKDCEQIDPHMGNWMRIHAYIKSFDVVGQLSLVDKMMMHELLYSRRMHVLMRLKGRRDALRKAIEDRELFRCGPFAA